jgi:hypothetical protein
MFKITIEKIIDDSILYSCDCGIKGKCIFKSFSVVGPSLVSIRCPLCGSHVNVSIGLIPECKQEEDINYSLSVIINNEIIK